MPLVASSRIIICIRHVSLAAASFHSEVLAMTSSIVLQILARMEKNLTAESQREIFLYVSQPELLNDNIITIKMLLPL